MCGRWRNVTLGSPRRLNLRLFYTAKTPVSQLLDVWPSHPIVVRANGLLSWDLDNLIATLKHNDRACIIQLWSVPSSLLELVSAAMQDQFPELTELEILSRDNTSTPPVVLGWIFTTSAITLVGSSSISRIAEATYFHRPLTLSGSPLAYSPFRVLFT